MVTGFEYPDALGALGAVAVMDVAGQRPGEGVPVEALGVVDDELGDREEVTLDGVEVAVQRLYRSRSRMAPVACGSKPSGQVVCAS
jgi:hypothetical protein